MKVYLSTILLILAFSSLEAQTCTTPGQNPSTAFPVCGTSTFVQNSVPLCGGKTVPTSGCNGVTDINPFWYKFTCFQSGTLGFKIKPHTLSDDYDWQLFDITGQNPDNVYTNFSLTRSFNWSGEGGETGASSAGSSLFVCDGLGQPLWSSMPILTQGHEYLLLISHFTNTQSGYDLSFGGGTAVITDTTLPALKSADASCGGNQVRVKLNKKMKCNSVALNGSDFFITPGNIPVTNVQPLECTSGFDTDSILVNLSTFLAPGTYSLNVKTGNDNNTILDYCNKNIPVNSKVDFTVYPLVETPMDSMVALSCAPDRIRLIFKKPMLCSSVAANGSDFILSGPSAVAVSGANGTCTNGATLSKEIIVQLNGPLVVGGTYTLTLQTGTDGNTVLDECGKETSAGSSLSFTIKDTVNADFSFIKRYGCSRDTVDYFHPGGNGINSWNWSLDDNLTSTIQNPQVLYAVFDTKDVSLIVSNGFCSDTVSKTVALTNFLKADFTVFEDLCPNEPTQFMGNAQGIQLSHQWSFGDGGSSDQEDPTHTYAGLLSTIAYTVSYTVTDSLGCTQTAQKPVKVYSSCYLAVPNAFTPNKDGKNDMLYPLNAVKAENLHFRVFNRWGQLVFQTRNWKQGWDGTIKGSQQGAGVYVWFLTYTDRDTKEKRQMKGTAVLIR